MSARGKRRGGNAGARGKDLTRGEGSEWQTVSDGDGEPGDERLRLRDGGS